MQLSLILFNQHSLCDLKRYSNNEIYTETSTPENRFISFAMETARGEREYSNSTNERDGEKNLRNRKLDFVVSFLSQGT